MKLQGFIIIFIVIILPIVLVLSVYLHGQIDTIALQTQYDNTLLNATHDAVMALERNTAHEDLSTVSDELRSMIEASTSIFMNTLSTGLGMSNANDVYFKPYVPALLYTLYDGFYIYSPTQVPVISKKTDSDMNPESGKNDRGVAKRDENGQILYLKDNGTETTNVNEAKTTIDYILKPYIYYNANYISDESGKYFNISVNYSLDNYVSITGSIADAYYSKSGYLIDTSIFQSSETGIYVAKDDWYDSVIFNLYDSSINNDKEQFENKYGSIIGSIDSKTNLLEFNDEQLIEDICSLNGIELVLKMQDRKCNNEIITISNDPWESFNGKVDVIDRVVQDYNSYVEKLDLATLTDEEIDQINSSKLLIEHKQEYNTQSLDSICYYGKSYIFTKWVEDNLKQINPSKHLHNVSADYATTYLANESTTKYLKMDYNIFDFTANGGPEDETSAFYNHRLEVIKSSIQYNLNSAISNYNALSEGSDSNYDFEMPMLSGSEWDKVLSNISMVSFFQGYPCKGKVYNNYAIVSSTSSEMMVNPGNISNPRSNVINSEGDKIVNAGNLFFVEYEGSNDSYSKYHRIDCSDLGAEAQSDTKYLGFKSIDYIYDRYLKKGASEYTYDHKNLGCYNCIVDGNYTDNRIEWNDLPNSKRTAYFIALGKERYRLHKTTATVNNSGFQIIPSTSIHQYDYHNPEDCNTSINLSAGRTLSDIRTIEVVFGKTQIYTRKTIQLADLTISLGGSEITTKIAANQSTNKTIVWDNVNIDSNSGSGTLHIEAKATDTSNKNTSSNTYVLTDMEIKSIKIIYK